MHIMPCKRIFSCQFFYFGESAVRYAACQNIEKLLSSFHSMLYTACRNCNTAKIAANAENWVFFFFSKELVSFNLPSAKSAFTRHLSAALNVISEGNMVCNLGRFRVNLFNLQRYLVSFSQLEGPFSWGHNSFWRLFLFFFFSVGSSPLTIDGPSAEGQHYIL